jgi:hypothetical protein
LPPIIKSRNSRRANGLVPRLGFGLGAILPAIIFADAGPFFEKVAGELLWFHFGVMGADRS